MEIETDYDARAPRLLFYGQTKVGKSSFAAGAPSPLFLDFEDSLPQLNLAKKPPRVGGSKLRTLEDVLKLLVELVNDKHDYKTLVIDTIDAAEPLIRAKVIATTPKMDEAAYSAYGHGENLSIPLWQKILNGCDMLRERRGMTIVLLSHLATENVTNPTGADYVKSTFAVPKKPREIFRRWADVIAWAKIKSDVTEDGKLKVDTERVVLLQPGDGFDAGARGKWPRMLSRFDWQTFADAYAKSQAQEPKPEAVASTTTEKSK